MRFTNEFIEQVRQANDIVSVISDYLVLQRRDAISGHAVRSIMKKRLRSVSLLIKDSIIVLAVMPTEMFSNSS